ncbi:MAG TPA: ATP-binding cassette domain-containing protein, partial [Myxococcaceae bacterium]|nr:ATP-binding cassette domain-containing protein [Myxococcaceae bacterium]
MIRFEHLSKAFGSKEIYRDLNLAIQEGETLTVIGGSGAGKSVLLKCLIGLTHPDEGRVIFQGQDVTDFAEEEYFEVRRKVAMVFQGSALFDSISVGDNIAYPLREQFPDMTEDDIRER